MAYFIQTWISPACSSHACRCPGQREGAGLFPVGEGWVHAGAHLAEGLSGRPGPWSKSPWSGLFPHWEKEGLALSLALSPRPSASRASGPATSFPPQMARQGPGPHFMDAEADSGSAPNLPNWAQRTGLQASGFLLPQEP